MDLLTGVDPTASWWLANIVLVVVTGVVAILLIAVIRTARAIQAEVAEIWVRGQRVANNTIHIANLHKTAGTVGQILAGTGSIAGHATAIKEHAESCPGCPACIWQKTGG